MAIKLYGGCWCDVAGHWIPRDCVFRPHTNGFYRVADHDYLEDGTPADHNPDAPAIQAVYELEVDPVKDAVRRRSRRDLHDALKAAGIVMIPKIDPRTWRPDQ